MVIKEYGSAFAWLAAVVLLLAYEALAYSSFERERPYLAWLTACLVILAAGWTTARYLKKSRKLRDGSPLVAGTADHPGPEGSP